MDLSYGETAEAYRAEVAAFLQANWTPGADLRGAVAGWIAGRLPLAREPEAHGPGRAIALVGQSGVGKTTTACKLAAAAAGACRRVRNHWAIDQPRAR